MPRQAPPTDLQPFFLVTQDIYDHHGGHLDWAEFFGNSQPVELDIGSGRGLHLVSAGEAHPEINYLGIEIDYREGRRAARRIQKRNYPNVRVLGGDAREVLAKLITPHTVQAVHVYFPDPWWKKKHWRRRIFNDDFVALVSRVLQPGGHLHAWTDVEPYFEVMKALMDHHVDFEIRTPPPEKTPEHDMDYRTSFERKKRKLGLPIYRGLWQRRPLEQNAGDVADNPEST